MDVTSIDAGSDFRREITRAIGSSSTVLIMIGRRWDVNRLNDQDDLVRTEIETALRGGMTIIPVLVAGAEMPTRAQLPPSVRALSDRNAVRLYSDDFRVSADRLLAVLRRPRKQDASQADGLRPGPTWPTPHETTRPTTTTPPYSEPTRAQRTTRNGAAIFWSILGIFAVVGSALGLVVGRPGGVGTLLWIIAVILVVAGIFAIIRRQLLWGVVLIVVGLLVGPGGVSIFT